MRYLLVMVSAALISSQPVLADDVTLCFEKAWAHPNDGGLGMPRGLAVELCRGATNMNEVTQCYEKAWAHPNDGEFQHSYINPEERRSRENFYDKLIWVVDGTRRVKDKRRFFDVLAEGATRADYPNLKSTFPEGALFRDWIQSTAHVMFDFGDEDLWWLLPQSNDFYALVLPFKRQKFVEIHRENYISRKNEFEIIFNKYDLKLPALTSPPTLTFPSIDEENVHPNTILRLMNNRRRSRL